MTTSMLLMRSPVGPLELTSDGEALISARFLANEVEDEVDAVTTRPEPLLAEARAQFDAYFAGDLEDFDLPLAARGTDFQQRVWQQLRAIPYGVTASYGQIADRLDMPRGAARAVGLANGANPIAIAVPCHRVIGAKGTLVGYAGGLARKKFLLDLESRDLLLLT